MNCQISSTAESMALFRAVEFTAPPSQRRFADPLARFFLSRSKRIAVRASESLPLVRTALVKFIDSRWPGARVSGVARTCFIDRFVVEALASGISQVVILGAGFDSRAYRIPEMERVKVFEVDRLPTQAAKRDRLATRLHGLPSHVKFVAIDFLRQRLDGVLASAGFQIGEPTCFVWEGVTNYLDGEAVDKTLRFVGRCAPASMIAFTYIHRGLIDGSGEFTVSPNVKRLLRRVGEQWTFGFYPDELRPYLSSRRLDLTQDLDAIGYGALCENASEDEIKSFEFYHLALAQVQQEDRTSAEGK